MVKISLYENYLRDYISEAEEMKVIIKELKRQNATYRKRKSQDAGVQTDVAGSVNNEEEMPIKIYNELSRAHQKQVNGYLSDKEKTSIPETDGNSVGLHLYETKLAALMTSNEILEGQLAAALASREAADTNFSSVAKSKQKVEKTLAETAKEMELMKENLGSALAELQKSLQNEITLRKAAEEEVNSLKSQLLQCRSSEAVGNAEILKLRKLLEDKEHQKEKLEKEITGLRSQLPQLSFEADEESSTRKRKCVNISSPDAPSLATSQFEVPNLKLCTTKPHTRGKSGCPKLSREVDDLDISSKAFPTLVLDPCTTRRHTRSMENEKTSTGRHTHSLEKEKTSTRHSIEKEKTSTRRATRSRTQATGTRRVTRSMTQATSTRQVTQSMTQAMGTRRVIRSMTEASDIAKKLGMTEPGTRKRKHAIPDVPSLSTSKVPKMKNASPHTA